MIGRKYELTRLLGEGGMGLVFEAEHQQLGKRVAVKFVRTEYVQNQEVMQRFTREAQAAAAIGHKSIIDVYDVGTDGDTAFLVMEFLEGQSLGELLEARPVLPTELTLHVIARVLSGLEAAHSKGIIHRDLKPDNIFLVETGAEMPEIKLLDFGISKVVDTNSPAEHLTATGALLGTPLYMAPEQAMGQRELDQRVDIYSIGVILYQAFTGQLPFRGENAVELLLKVVNEPATPPRAIRADISPELEAVVMRAMATDRENRFATATEMLDGLRPFLELPESAASGAPPRVSVAPSDSAIPFEAPTEIDSFPRQLEGSADLQVSESPPRRGKGLFIVGGLAGLLLVLGGLGTAAAFLSSAGESGEAGNVAASDTPRAATVAVDAEPHSAVEAPASAAASAAADSTDAAGATPPDPEVVTLTLTNVPEGGRVLLDGAGVDGSSLRMRRSELMREVRVELDDGRVWRHMVTPDRDRTYEVQLEEPPTGHRRSRRVRGPRRPSQPAEPPQRPAQEPTKRGPGRGFNPVFE